MGEYDPDFPGQILGNQCYFCGKIYEGKGKGTYPENERLRGYSHGSCPDCTTVYNTIKYRRGMSRESIRRAEHGSEGIGRIFHRWGRQKHGG